MPFATIATSVETAFVADSLSLGAHWVYDSNVIKEKLGANVRHFHAPGLFNDYHKGKHEGDQTHYGDQMLWLLESIKENNGYNEEAWKDKWYKKMETYAGYRDHATKDTLENRTASNSKDLSGAARFVPLILVCTNEDSLVAAARSQAKITHDDPLVLNAAEFFARVYFRVSRARGVQAAIKEAVELTHCAELASLVHKGIESAGHRDTEKELKAFGKGCAANSAIPGTIHIIMKYAGAASKIEEALVDNVEAGGDQAARAILIGAILGAQPAVSLPHEWTSKLKVREFVHSTATHLVEELKVAVEREREDKEHHKREEVERRMHDDQDEKVRLDRQMKLSQLK